VAGRYHCDALNAALTVTDTGGALYGSFSGVLGQGRMEQLERIGRDVWALPCPRALDHTPPGDWTLAFRRNTSGGIDGVQVGCWLARGLEYRRAA
jgi:D-aminopeptidase